jgi:hypothetical protein
MKGTFFKPAKGKRLNVRKPVRKVSSRQRAEQPVIKRVRAACVERDGYCRLSGFPLAYGPCEGPSEWAHLFDKKRSATRRMSPEARHDTRWTAMLCQRHHRLEDLHVISIRAEDALKGADGPLLVRHLVECVA